MKNLRRFAALPIITIAAALAAAFAAFADAPLTFKYFEGRNFCDYTLTPAPAVNGYGVLVCNLADGAVIYDKNPDDMVYPASTVKLMTAIVAYRPIGP